MTNYLKSFVIPVSAFALVLLISVRYGNVWIHYRDLLLVLPYVLFAAGSIVALYLLQYAFVYTAVLFVCVYALIQLHLQMTLSDPIVYSAFIFVNVLFPILLLLCVLLGRKTLISLWAIVLLISMSSMIWLPFVFWYIDVVPLLNLLPAVFFTAVKSDSWFVVGLLLSYLPVFIFLASLYGLNPTRLQALWLVGLLAVLSVFVWFNIPYISAVTFSVFGALLLVGLLQEAFQLAYIDELTGIPGRKALQKQMLSLGRRYSIAMLDVDHFKKFNDTHGHDVGDQVLRMVAANINRVGGGGKAYRYGGEEFTVLFPGKTTEQTLVHLEAVREMIADYTMLIREKSRPDDDKEGKKKRSGASGKGVKVTISMGVTQRSDTAKTPDDVIKQADEALYIAKKSGRNCVKSI
jgi:GGDEF domain-containing protein